MASQFEYDYCDLITDIMRDGSNRQTRSAPARAVFGKMLTVHELKWGQFPILQGRRMYYKGVFGELAAFLKGPKTLQDFEKEGCNYWEKWANEDGTIDLDYGNAWIDFNGVNQLETVLDSLSQDPTGRRHIISAWRPDNLPYLSLPCCHLLYQWYVDDQYLDMIWYQRSVDTMIGLPSDIIMAAAWNILMAEHLELHPGKLIFMLGDTHIYQSHWEAVDEYLKSVHLVGASPVSYYNDGSIYDFNANSISIINYNPMNPIRFELHG